MDQDFTIGRRVSAKFFGAGVIIEADADKLTVRWETTGQIDTFPRSRIVVMPDQKPAPKPVLSKKEQDAIADNKARLRELGWPVKRKKK